MQADEDQPAFASEPAEEIEHETDVAVLRVELRLVEQVHARIVAACVFEKQRWRTDTPLADLIRLVIVDRQPIALPRLDPVDVLTRAEHAPGIGNIAASDHFEQRRLAGAVRAENADNLGLGELQLDLERKRRLPSEPTAPVALVQPVEHE